MFVGTGVGGRFFLFIFYLLRGVNVRGHWRGRACVRACAGVVFCMILLNSLIEVKTEGQTGRAGRVPLTFVLQVKIICPLLRGK